MADINIKAKITTDTGEAGKGVEQFENKIKSAGNAAKGSGQDFGKLKDTVGSLGPVGEQATAKMGMLNQAFNVLKANPIIAVFAAIAAVVIAIVQRMSEMEAVSDALGKAFGTLSGIINAFVSKVLTPLIDGFVWLIENTTSGIVKVLEMMGVSSEGAAEKFGQLNEELDNMEDAQKDNEIAMAQANRRMQEAREIAADANIPIKDRIKALRDAAKEEIEQGKIIMEFNRAKYANLLETYALENNARKETIALIQKGTIESLLAARAQLLADKQGNHDKINELNRYIIEAEEKQKQIAIISRKTQGQITGLENEEQKKREQQQKEHQERIRKQEEAHLKEQEFIRKTYADYEKARFAGQMKNAEDKTKKDEEDRKKAKEQEALDMAKMEADAQEVSSKDLVNYKLYVASKEEVDKAHLEHKKAMQDAEFGIAEQGVNLLKMLAGNNKALQKAAIVAENAISIAKIITNTNAANAAAVAKYSLIPGGQALSAAEITLNKISAGIGIASNVVATAKALQSIGGGGTAQGGNVPNQTVSASAPLTPATGTTTLDAQSIQNIGNAAASGVNRSYVLETDIRNNSERSARLQRAARLA